MKSLIVLWDFPVCKKLGDKLILLVYSVNLGHDLFLNLKQKKPHLVWGEELIPFLKFLKI